MVDKIEILHSTGATDYFLDLYLETVIKPFGLYDYYNTTDNTIQGKLNSLDIVNKLPVNPSGRSSSYIVTGYCDNRLEEIKCYEKNNQFKIGVKGVTNVDPGQVEYTIDGINYITLFDANFTTVFSYNTKFIPDDNNSYKLLFDETNYGYSKRPIFDVDINVDRPAYTVTDSHLRLSNIKNMFDFETYGGNYYNIYEG